MKICPIAYHNCAILGSKTKNFSKVAKDLIFFENCQILPSLITF